MFDLVHPQSTEQADTGLLRVCEAELGVTGTYPIGGLEQNAFVDTNRRPNQLLGHTRLSDRGRTASLDLRLLLSS